VTALLAVVAAALLLDACSETRKIFGREKQSPDEFAVYSRAPLSLPPDYGLRPPEPGATRPQGAGPQLQSQQALLGGARPAPAQAPAAGPGLQALLQQSGALNADPDIRATVNRESSLLATEDISLTERLMFWGTPNEYGTVVDPAGESKRIRENQALGRPLTEGETPTIKRKRKALLEGIFE
jgi:hypothetical protein